ncbi:MAG: hypothetical protein K0Q94_6393, partial [Paenibacillus sp.]|nr:hypothetical protein [Paenibacillus sp.]MDF2663602.1 hypothetical protein [Paenibacillus sp.]
MVHEQIAFDPPVEQLSLLVRV